ncbi:hypothetical protein GCM10022233_48900 [Streptomyces shaanxiensis]|uniref:Uncharacterized protein n=1 Tax=Streptomyces shaanxiensis TaxID=653357 RepID=A0ABP7VHS2_9ACTN
MKGANGRLPFALTDSLGLTLTSELQSGFADGLELRPEVTAADGSPGGAHRFRWSSTAFALHTAA